MHPEQAKIYTAVLISSFLLGAIIIYFCVSLVRHQKRFFDMSRKNMLAELNVLEREHTRIAQDLHDELGPILTAVKFNISGLEITKGEEYIAARAVEQIDLAIHRIREVSKDLMPAALKRHSLQDALEDFIATVPKTTHIKLRYHVRRKLEAEKSLHVYRLLKEIIQNTVKHAAANNLGIQLEEFPKTLAIVCEDDGKGFDYTHRLAHSEGIGLRSLKGRVEMLGGRMEVQSVLGRGTQFKIDIPLPLLPPND